VSFVLEEWKAEQGNGGFGQFVFQTWLVPKQGSPIRLMPVPLYDGLSSDSIGFESIYSFSPISRYIFREQKIAHGESGAYIYGRDSGLGYSVIVPNLQKGAVAFFQSSTGLTFEYGGIVEFVNWVSPDAIAISLRGSSAGRKFSIFNWRCVISIPSQSFSIPDE
jgi:hypothetical protein